MKFEWNLSKGGSKSTKARRLLRQQCEHSRTICQRRFLTPIIPKVKSGSSHTGWELMENYWLSPTLNKAAQSQQTSLVTLILNKPIGYVSGQPEPGYRPAVVLIKPENQFINPQSTKRFQPAHLKNLAPAGRLDIDSQGLLILTQDGRIAKQLIGADSEIEKEYLVRVEGALPKDKLALLNHGLSLDGKALKPAQVSWQNQNQLRFILQEGKKRQIRRMCELVNLKVTGLKRVRIGNIGLRDLPEGKWRYLQDSEHF